MSLIKKSGELTVKNVIIISLIFLINFLIIGCIRISSLIFLAAVDHFEITREAASMPFFLTAAIRVISGPFTGYFATKFGSRCVTLYGCILSVVGIGTCYFAQSILLVNICWGIVFGFGAGLSTLLFPQILNEHFKRNLDKVYGITLAAECLPIFITPIFFLYLVDKYGLLGTFLIMAALVLHTIPAALLLIILRPTQNIEMRYTRQISEKEQNILKNQDSFKFHTPSNFQLCKNQFDVIDKSKIENDLCFVGQTFEDLTIPEHETCITQCDIMYEKDYHVKSFDLYHSNNLKNSKVQLSGEATLKTKNAIISLSTTEIGEIGKQKFNQAAKIETKVTNLSTISNLTSEAKICEDPNTKIPKHYNKDYSKRNLNQNHTSNFRLFLNPIYIIIAISQSILCVVTFGDFTVIVDFCKDYGIASHEEIYPVMVFTIADLIGRLTVGFFTDGGYFSGLNFMILSCFIVGLIHIILLNLKGTLIILSTFFIMGLFLGGLYTVSSGIVIKFIKEDKLPLALSLRFSPAFPLLLSISFIIGYFREQKGSYDGVFYLFATLTLISFLLALVLSVLAKLKKEKCTEKINNNTRIENLKS